MKKQKTWLFLIVPALILVTIGGTVLVLDPYDWYHHYETDEPYTLFSAQIEGIYAININDTWIPSQSTNPQAWLLTSIGIDNGYHIFINLKENWALWSESFTFWYNGTAQIFNCTFHESTEDTLFVEEMNTNMLVINHEDYFTFLVIEIFIIIPFERNIVTVGETNF
jgi:hypothetical protein